MASISKRPNGKFKISYRADGKQHSKTVKTLRAAQRFAIAVEQQLEDRTWRDPSEGKRTLATVAEMWIGRKETLKVGTLKNYRIAIDRHIVPHLGDMRIDRLDPQTIDKWLADLRRSGVGPTAIVRAFRVLGSITDLAQEYKLILSSPMPREKPRMPASKEMKFLDRAEIDTLAQAIDPRYRVWVYTMSYTGLRWSEAAGLKVQRIDTMRRRIEVVEQLVEVSGKARVQTLKSKAGSRTIPIPTWLCDLLTEQIAGKNPTDWAFTTRSGTHLSPSNFWASIWKPATRKAGLEGLRIHDLRHSHASMLIAQGMDLKVVSERLGHASAAFTLTRYVHTTPSRHEEVADRLEAFDPSATIDAVVIALR